MAGIKDGLKNRVTVAELLCSALSLFGQMATQKYMRAMKFFSNQSQLLVRTVAEKTWRFISATTVAALRSAVDLCRPRKLIKLRNAVLSERVGVFVMAVANACANREERQCNDSGKITLVDMVIFSSCRKRVAFADWIGQGADYSSTCAGTESAWSGSAHFAQQTPIASLLSGLRAAEWGLAASSLSTTYCVLANPTNREDGRHWAGHLPM